HVKKGNSSRYTYSVETSHMINMDGNFRVNHHNRYGSSAFKDVRVTASTKLQMKDVPGRRDENPGREHAPKCSEAGFSVDT
ncbi:hypothetical protein M758_8G109800, partial [Ceratodon purpureus]